MPNHVATKLVVKGQKDEVARFIQQAVGPDGKFGFEGVYPMPPEIRDTTAPATIVSQAEYDKALAEFQKLTAEQKEKGLQRCCHCMTQAMSDDLVLRFGTNNWYDWACRCYGTKWGAYDAGEWTVKEDGTEASVFYNTAWSPATAFYEKVSKDFKLEFTHFFADEGGGFVGSETLENGEITQSEDLNWNGPAGIALREELGYYHPEDDEDEVVVKE